MFSHCICSSMLSPNFLYCSSLFLLKSSNMAYCCYNFKNSLLYRSLASLICFLDCSSFYIQPFLFIDRFLRVSSNAYTMLVFVYTANSLCSSDSYMVKFIIALIASLIVLYILLIEMKVTVPHSFCSR